MAFLPGSPIPKPKALIRSRESQHIQGKLIEYTPMESPLNHSSGDGIRKFGQSGFDVLYCGNHLECPTNEAGHKCSMGINCPMHEMSCQDLPGGMVSPESTDEKSLLACKYSSDKMTQDVDAATKESGEVSQGDGSRHAA